MEAHIQDYRQAYAHLPPVPGLKDKEQIGVKSFILRTVSVGGVWEIDQIKKRILHNFPHASFADITFRQALVELRKRDLLYRPMTGLYIHPEAYNKRIKTAIKDFTFHYCGTFGMRQSNVYSRISHIQRIVFKTSLVIFPLGLMEEEFKKLKDQGLVSIHKGKFRWIGKEHQAMAIRDEILSKLKR